MFLKYLLDKKLISSDQALDASVAYLEAQPSLLKIIAREKVLSSEKLMDIYCRAGIEKKSFYEMFKLHSGLTAADIEQIFQAQQMAGKSLGQVMVEKGFLAQDKWESAIRDYIHNAKPACEEVATQSEQPVVQEAPATQPVMDIPAGISAAALESLMEVQGLDPSQLKELESQMAPSSEAPEEITEEVTEKISNEEDISSIMQIDNSLANEPMSIYAEEFFDHHNEEMQSELLVVANRYRLKKREKDLSLFHQNMAKILSLVKLSEFPYLEKLITPYETLMNHIMDNTKELPENWDGLVSEMLDLLWKFRMQLKEGKNEGIILSDDSFKSKYITNIKSIMAHLKR